MMNTTIWVSRKAPAILCAIVLAVGSQIVSAAGQSSAAALRPPSVPLVACDPYFSIWSPADKLTDADTVHWTGKPHPLRSVLRIDGRSYRVMGAGAPDERVLEQKGLTVMPTRTIYTFEGAGMALTLTFMTPALPDDLMIYSRPVTYVTYELRSIDGKTHDVVVGLGAFAAIAVNDPKQQVVLSIPTVDDALRVAKVGSRDQPILGKKGDDLRIDWGYLFLAAPASQQAKVRAQPESSAGDPSSNARELKAEGAVVSVQFDDFKVSSRPVSRWLILAYDDEYSIQYFKKNLRPYWRRNGDDAAALLKKASREYESLKKRCERFDTELMAALSKAGGEKYAQICALAYRQCCAANKVVADDSGQPLMFPKENFSNGCIGTVDVIYPMAPQFLLFSPSLTKAMLVPILDYAASARWRWPFAPHDLGTYPLANGQVYGGGERTEQDQMPVEESGNMLALLAALARAEGMRTSA